MSDARRGSGRPADAPCHVRRLGLTIDRKNCVTREVSVRAWSGETNHVKPHLGKARGHVHSFWPLPEVHEDGIPIRGLCLDGRGICGVGPNPAAAPTSRVDYPYWTDGTVDHARPDLCTPFVERYNHQGQKRQNLRLSCKIDEGGFAPILP